MKDCEHLLEEIADRQKQIFEILAFFKAVLIVVLCFVGLAFLMFVGFWVTIGVALSALVNSL